MSNQEEWRTDPPDWEDDGKEVEVERRDGTLARGNLHIEAVRVEIQGTIEERMGCWIVGVGSAGGRASGMIESFKRWRFTNE